MEDLRLITEEDAVSRVMKPHYWDRWKADRIKKPVRRQLGSGLGLGFGKERHYRGTAILGVSVDGIVGEKTLAAINGRNARELFADIKRARISFIEGIIKRDPSQMVFKKGWLSPA